MNETRKTIIRPKRAAQIVGVDLSTLYDWARKGKFPKPFKIGGPGSRASGWFEDDIIRHLENAAQ